MRVFNDKEMIEYEDGAFLIVENLFHNLTKDEGLQIIKLFDEIRNKIPKDILSTMEWITYEDIVPKDKIEEYIEQIKEYDNILEEGISKIINSFNLTDEHKGYFRVSSLFHFYKYLSSLFLSNNEKLDSLKTFTWSEVFKLKDLELSFKLSILEDFIEDWKKLSPDQIEWILELDYKLDNEKKVIEEEWQEWINNRKERLFEIYIYKNFPDWITDNQKEILGNPEKLEELQNFMKSFYRK